VRGAEVSDWALPDRSNSNVSNLVDGADHRIGSVPAAAPADVPMYVHAGDLRGSGTVSPASATTQELPVLHPGVAQTEDDIIMVSVPGS